MCILPCRNNIILNVWDLFTGHRFAYLIIHLGCSQKRANWRIILNIKLQRQGLPPLLSRMAGVTLEGFTLLQQDQGC